MTQKTNNDEDFHPAIDASNDPTRNLIMNSLNTGFVE
ncbi:unnamed protein product, partial [Rotaria socialis]